MNAIELKKAQQEIWNEIEKRAKELEFDRYPIKDGVCDFEGYLQSSPKVMWILKEPNGQCPNGKLEDGGWSIVEDSFRDDIEGTAKQPTWQTMIYVMYGYQNGLKYDDMDYIHNKIEMAKVMQSIAYLNVSKMPGYNKSVKSNIEQRYTQWKPILNKQIETYAPNLIIFGNTFDHFKNDFKIRGLEKIGNIPGWIDVYKSGQLIILDAYHPSRKGRDYVNTLIEALNLYPQ
jgi:hypothetical protein